MKRITGLLIACFLLFGCLPSRGLKPSSEWRNIQVEQHQICFTIDKKDVVSFYNLSSTHNGEYKELAVKERVKLSYPQTCIGQTLTPYNIYAVDYTLNGINYRYVFFIDKDWNVENFYNGDK